MRILLLVLFFSGCQTANDKRLIRIEKKVTELTELLEELSTQCTIEQSAPSKKRRGK